MLKKILPVLCVGALLAVAMPAQAISFLCILAVAALAAAIINPIPGDEMLILTAVVIACES